MTDNVSFQGTGWSPPENTTVATDYAATGGGGSAHFQRIKLDVGADGTTIAVTQDAPLPIGTLPGGTVQAHGTTQILGTVQAVAGGTVQVHGTLQALGTVQPLAGSVHPAAPLPGTSHITGTVRILDPAAVTQSGAWSVDVTGTVQSHGTAQALGTYQPLAGSVHLASALPGGSVSVQGYVAHGAAAAGNPVPLAGFGSSGAPTAVDEQDVVRLWADLAGRLQVVGSVTATPTGTTQALGTYQPLAGSVHVANTITGTVQTHGTSQVLGTVRIVDPAAVSQSGAWNVTVTGTVQAHGTNQALGTFQPLAGSVHVANVLSGTFQPHGTGQVLGTIQAHGTSQALGTVQPLAGSVHPAAALPGTSQVSGTVREAGRGVAPARTSVAAGTLTATLIGANPARAGVAVYNDATSILYLALGSAAGTIDYTVQMQPRAYYETPWGYTGTLSGLWAPGTTAAGTAYLTEIA